VSLRCISRGKAWRDSRGKSYGGRLETPGDARSTRRGEEQGGLFVERGDRDKTPRQKNYVRRGRSSKVPITQIIKKKNERKMSCGGYRAKDLGHHNSEGKPNAFSLMEKKPLAFSEEVKLKSPSESDDRRIGRRGECEISPGRSPKLVHAKAGTGRRTL